MNKFKYIKLTEPRSSFPFCVDGRTGKRKINNHEIKQPYPQMLGGSLNAVIVVGTLRTDDNGNPLLATQDFINLGQDVFRELKNAGFGLGLHTGGHANKDKKTSDCGFADNLVKIINYLRNKHKEKIENILKSTSLILENDKERWKEIMDLLNKIDLENVPSGEKIIAILKRSPKVAFQKLEGNHHETTALINYQDKKTLDTDNSQQKPAFNLDMWRIDIEARTLGIDKRKAELLTLGLYVATEIALVEDKGKKRLPILINK